MSKIILITGGGSGIGKSLAIALSREDHKVIICGRRIKRLKEVKREANVFYYKCDVSKESQVKKFAKIVKKKFLFIDVLINNAGIFGPIGRFDVTDSKKWKKTIEVNLFSIYLMCKYLLPLLLSSNVRKIINIAGGGSFNPFPNYSAYAVSKAGVVRLTETLAEELKDLNFKINCVAPGFVNTELHIATLKAGEKLAGRQYQITVEKMKAGSIPIEVPVNCIKFLISDEAKDLTGKTISASFDKWSSPYFKELIEEINKSDLYTQRRINIVNLSESELKEKMKLL